MKLRNMVSILLAFAIMAFPIKVYATSENYIIDLSEVSTFSYDSSFTLDFSDSAVWGVDFDNNVFLTSNHKYVKISYLSCTPLEANAKVQVQLYIDENGNGEYEECDGYTDTIIVGDSLRITLPYGSTVKNYRLKILNLSYYSVKSGTFSVKTMNS